MNAIVYSLISSIETDVLRHLNSFFNKIPACRRKMAFYLYISHLKCAWNLIKIFVSLHYFILRA